MTTRFLAALTLCGATLLGAPAMALPAAPGLGPVAPIHDVSYRHRRHRPGGPHYYHVNRYGFGSYRRGPRGGFGGYPAGSAGAIELQNNHRIRCENSPSRC
jgi:hypothetical protein